MGLFKIKLKVMKKIKGKKSSREIEKDRDVKEKNRKKIARYIKEGYSIGGIQKKCGNPSKK
jgi:hypothetical protein